MKKFFAALLLLALASMMVFAADPVADFTADVETNENTAFAESLRGYFPSSPRNMGMGGAGLSTTKGVDAIFINPSVLGQGDVNFSIPGITATVYHVYDIIKPGEDGKNAIDKIQEILDSGSTDTISDLLPVVSTLVGPGKGKLASIEASLGMTANMVGFGVNINDTIKTFDGSVYDDLKISSVLGFGMGFGNDMIQVSAGVSAKFNLNAFTKRITLSDFQTMASNESFTEIPVAIGYAMPLNAGVTVKAFGLSASLVLSDINLFGLGTYRYDAVMLDDFLASADSFGSAVGAIKDTKDAGDIEFTPIMRLDAGLGYEFNSSIISLKAAVDIIDVLAVKAGLDAGYQAKTVLLDHSKFGAEVGLFNLVKVRGGMNSGYFTLGGTVNLGFITVDAAYFWEEMGEFAGQKGLDGLTVKFNLGWDN